MSSPSDSPAFLQKGDLVSADNNGTYSEAKIIEVQKYVLCRVALDCDPTPFTVSLNTIHGPIIEAGQKALADYAHQNNMEVTILFIKDYSLYTVVLADGTQCQLNRTQIQLLDTSVQTPITIGTPIGRHDSSSDDEVETTL